MKPEPITPTFRARIRLLGSHEGGRQTPIYEGYRGNVWFGEMLDAREPLVNGCLVGTAAPIEPGGLGTADLTPLFPEFWADIARGQPFSIVEGTRTVGSGRITAAPDPEVRAACARRRLADDLERWVRSHVTTDVTRNDHGADRADFRLALDYGDDAHSIVVGQLKPGRVRRQDISELALRMEEARADFGVLIGLTEPSAALQRALFSYGTRSLPHGREIPRMLYLSASSLARTESWWFLERLHGGERAAATLDLAA